MCPLPNKYQGCPECAVLETWSELVRSISLYREGSLLWGQVLGSWKSLQSEGMALRAGLGQLEGLLLREKAKTQHTGMGVTLWADDTGHNLI